MIIGNTRALEKLIQTSACYVFNAAGFYPFCPGSPNYLIGSAKNNGPKNVYIQFAKLNGKPFTKTWLPHSVITAGGLLEFEMGSAPNEMWGSGEGDAPPNEMR